ncbi:hypothetical protein FRB94_010641 [Tulasnella sp. JGI-2019a]|nr:hypothetical protein FRB94_010641 [Tulasnella sp. JGI-2019a]KAG9011335.1 hypothetical protein FRB93_003137 [Tulasnella sp. JGI-2019a]KAG9037380.1 hypothetical protein FRB95_005669 [Tulasnella sp. JGI-2019a]
MSYTIKVNLTQSGHPFTVRDQAVRHNGGTWEGEGLYDMSLTLNMKNSGFAGALLCRRAKDDDSCCILVGVVGYKPFCDVVTDLSPDDTAVGIIETVYGRSNWVRKAKETKTTSKGTVVEVGFLNVDGNSLNAEIKITS